MAAVSNAPHATGHERTVGFQQLKVPDPQGKPLAVGIWYPSDAAATNAPIDMSTQVVATDGPLAGTHLPLILISHGTRGSRWQAITILRWRWLVPVL